MSVHTTNSKAGPYLADGSQRDFPFRFPFIEPGHVAVYFGNVRVSEGEYLVYREGQGGGRVSFNIPPESGVKVTILRDVPLTQETDIQNNTAFYPEVLETAYDKLTMICQQIAEEMQRVIKVGVGDADISPGVLIQSVFDANAAAQKSSAEAAKSASAAQKSSAEAAKSASAAQKSSAEAEEAAVRAEALLDKTGGLPIGSIFPFPASIPPEGAYLLNGQTIAGCNTLYPKFFEWVSTAGVRIIDSATYEAELASAGVCGGFVVDTSAGSVRLPTLVNGTLWGTDSATIGQSLAAGLPNITGTFIPGTGEGPSESVLFGGFGANSTGTGALYDKVYQTSGQHITTNSSGAYPADSMGLDASRSNPIYGNSDTVQPPAIRVSWCIQVFNAATDLSEQQSAQLASEMQLKAQTDLANVSSNIDYVVESWRDNNGNWYRKYRSGWVEQGGVVHDGVVTFFIEMSDNSYWVMTQPFTESTYALAGMHWNITNKTTTGFYTGNYPSQISNDTKNWIVKGNALLD